LTVATDQGFEQPFGCILDDESIDIDAPPEMLERYGFTDSAEELGLFDKTD